jgi:hypothetical protein
VVYIQDSKKLEQVYLLSQPHSFDVSCFNVYEHNINRITGKTSYLRHDYKDWKSDAEFCYQVWSKNLYKNLYSFTALTLDSQDLMLNYVSNLLPIMGAHGKESFQLSPLWHDYADVCKETLLLAQVGRESEILKNLSSCSCSESWQIN